MKIKKKLIFDVVGALIEDNGRFLVCQRLENDRFGSQWEFPGGKVEKHEDKESALKRELKEELGIDIKVDQFVHTLEDEIPEMKITVYLYKCTILKGRPQCLECQDIKWLSVEEIKNLDLAPADKKIQAFLETPRP